MTQPPAPKSPLTDWRMPLMMSLTLGLAPFAPEPHVVEKVRWVLQGGAGMKPVDVFDLLMHGGPWVWLGWTLVRLARAKVGAGAPAPS